MIASNANLTIAWLAPDLLLIDHVAHATPMDGARLAALVERLVTTPAQTTDPILVTCDEHGRFWVTNGRHRALAHLLAGRDSVPCVIVETVSG